MEACIHPRLLLWLVPLLALLGAGCGGSESNEPWTVTNESLAGRPPWAMDELSETEKIAEFRRHLEGVAKAEPGAKVIGRVMLYRRLTFVEFGALVRSYGLEGGDLANIGGTFGPPDDGARAFMAWRKERALQSFVEELLEASVQQYPDYPAAESTVLVDQFGAYGTTASFLALWNAHPDFIRGVVVGGRPGSSIQGVPVWVPGVGEPIR